MEHLFTTNIKAILKQEFGKNAESVFEKSLLVQYLNEKTRSANKGSKARSSFANLYAIYVIIEEVINITTLTSRFQETVKQGYLNKILDEIVLQSKVEFNYEEMEDEE
jgi:superfamily I DNA/RNA helicase